MYSEETKASTLAKLLLNFNLVLVDTCSLMEDSFPLFMDVLVASHGYWKEGVSVVILGECMDELKKHSKSSEFEKRINAKRALKIINHDQSIWNRKKVLKIEKASHKDAFADRAIYAKVSDLRIGQKILVITQDKKLKADIRGLNNLESQKGRNVHVYQIGKTGELEIKFDDRSAPVPARNFKDKKVLEKPIKKQFEEKPKAPQKPKNPNKSLVLSKEEALLANISNPNYPLNKKVEDIEKQIALLKTLTEEDKKDMKLHFTEEQLISEKKKLETPKQKEQTPKKPVEEPKKPKTEPKKDAQRPYYERGKTPSVALKKLGDHHGWMFRDPTLPFFQGIHGSVDLTTDDLALSDEKMSDLKPETTRDLKIKSLTLVFENTKNEFRVYVKPAEEPAKKEEPKPIEAKPEPTKAPKPKKEKKEKAKEVKEPVVEKKVEEKAPAKPKAKKEPKKAKENAAEPKPVSKKKSEPTKKEAEKKTEEKKAEVKKASKKEKPEAKKPVAKKAPTKKEPKPVEPALKKENGHSEGYAEAKKNDDVLNANLNNPNYPKATAVKEIEQQLERIRSLKPGESKGFRFGVRALQAKLKELK